MKIWTSANKGDDKIIAFFNNTIYKANPKTVEVDNYIASLKLNTIPSAGSIEIPLTYLKTILMEDGKKSIEVHFGGNSTEEFIITDDAVKKEIFACFRNNLPVEYSVNKNSKFKSAAKPLIAMGVIAPIFIWTLFVSIGMEAGDEYRLAGSGRSVAAIVLMLASLGVFKVVLIFSALLLVALISFLRKFKSSQQIHVLSVKR